MVLLLDHEELFPHPTDAFAGASEARSFRFACVCSTALLRVSVQRPFCMCLFNGPFVLYVSVQRPFCVCLFNGPFACVCSTALLRVSVQRPFCVCLFNGPYAEVVDIVSTLLLFVCLLPTATRTHAHHFQNLPSRHKSTRTTRRYRRKPWLHHWPNQTTTQRDG